MTDDDTELFCVEPTPRPMPEWPPLPLPPGIEAETEHYTASYDDPGLPLLRWQDAPWGGFGVQLGPLYDGWYVKLKLPDYPPVWIKPRHRAGRDANREAAIAWFEAERSRIPQEYRFDFTPQLVAQISEKA
jgi:hypothetical protein